jgi:hypothetical protein
VTDKMTWRGNSNIRELSGVIVKFSIWIASQNLCRTLKERSSNGRITSQLVAANKADLQFLLYPGSSQRSVGGRVDQWISEMDPVASCFSGYQAL